MRDEGNVATELSAERTRVERVVERDDLVIPFIERHEDVARRIVEIAHRSMVGEPDRDRRMVRSDSGYVVHDTREGARDEAEDQGDVRLDEAMLRIVPGANGVDAREILGRRLERGDDEVGHVFVYPLALPDPAMPPEAAKINVVIRIDWDKTRVAQSPP